MFKFIDKFIDNFREMNAITTLASKAQLVVSRWYNFNPSWDILSEIIPIAQRSYQELNEHEVAFIFIMAVSSRLSRDDPRVAIQIDKFIKAAEDAASRGLLPEPYLVPLRLLRQSL